MHGQVLPTVHAPQPIRQYGVGDIMRWGILPMCVNQKVAVYGDHAPALHSQLNDLSQVAPAR